MPARPARAALLLVALAAAPAAAQDAPPAAPPALDARMYGIVEAVSPARIQADIETLVSFGTRHTLSDTLSDTRGIGAARRWIKAELDRISAQCGGCLEVSYQHSMVHGTSRIPDSTWVVSVVAIQRGTTHPDRYVIMSGDIDSRVSDGMDYTSDSPGANDNASGVAGVLEAARVLTRHRFGKSVVYAALAGEEQGLFGGQHMARVAKEQGWRIEAVLNNDMIGNIEGVDGVIDNTSFRVFSEPVPPTTTPQEHRSHRFYGGEVDGPSRQLARYVDRVTDLYMAGENVDAMMIYRLDRFGRGGHHRPFNDEGFPAVRIMETHENYVRQHQTLRTENGVAYGDVIEGVDFDYAAKLTGVNAVTLASLAWAPPPPADVTVAGAVQPSTRLRWQPSDAPELAGYKVYWRLTTAPQWTDWVWVGRTDAHTLEGLVIDNYLFGVAAVANDGNESVVVFPTRGR